MANTQVSPRRLRSLNGDMTRLRRPALLLIAGLAATSTDPRLRWIAANCLHLRNATPALHDYYCQPNPAG